MKNYLISLISFALALCATACSEGPQTTVLKKVVFPGDYPDPSIVRDGNDFYMTNSSFTYYPGLRVWHSTDLVNWEPISFGITAEQDYSIFAPEICKVGDKFYIYYPTSAGVNYVVTADDPHGPWSDPVLLDAHGIDPGHVYGEDGKQYLYTNNGFCVELTDDGLAAAGEDRKLYDGWQFPQEWETEGFWLESPEAFPEGRLVLPRYRGRRHCRPSNQPYGCRSPQQVSPGPLGEQPLQPSCPYLFRRRGMVVQGPWHHLRRCRRQLVHNLPFIQERLPYPRPHFHHRIRHLDGRRLAETR